MKANFWGAFAWAATIAALSHAAPIWIQDYETGLDDPFNLPPAYSGSTQGVNAATDWINLTTSNAIGTASGILFIPHDPAGSPTSGGWQWQARILPNAGGSSNPNNPLFGADGYVGYYLKVDPGVTAAMQTAPILEGGSGTATQATSGLLRDVIKDGQWHLYQWNMDDPAEFPLSFGTVFGNTLGNTTLEATNSFDSIAIVSSSAGDATVLIDQIGYDSSGPLPEWIPPTFGDWASDQGYSPGAAMPSQVDAGLSLIASLAGIGDYDWTSAPTTSLALNNNLLSSVDAGVFSGLTNLIFLDLGGNQLTGITAGAFNGLTSLSDLRLYGNQIASVQVGAFSGLTNLTTLYLESNQLTSVETGVFSGLANLTALSLAGNQLASVQGGAFSGLANLIYLDLSGNQLSNTDSGDFNGLMNLTSLGLRYNQLTSIDSGDFDGLTNLTSLSLGYNQLTSIERNAFSGLTNLTFLDLGGNQLSSIETGDFNGLTNLTGLDLRYNQLTNIAAGAFSGLPNLTYLDLSDNPALTELNLAEADFSSLTYFDVSNNGNVVRVSLQNAVLNQTSLIALLDGAAGTGIGELGGITELDLSGINFANITDLSPLYVMDDSTELWLVSTLNLDAVDLDVLLDNLATIEGTDVEGILYLTQADFDAFNTAGGGLLAAWDAEPGHHVEFVVPTLPGDFDGDGDVDGRDFLAWQRNPSLGNLADWQANYGAPMASTPRIAIPEPSSALLLVGLAALTSRRRK